jgi:hypothetical protein
MDIPPAVVGAYEEFFFSVRDRLDAADFVLSTLIGYTPFRGFDQGDWRGLWAYFAYTAGPKMLEIAMAVSRGRPLPDCAMRDRASAEVLEFGARAMLLACTGTMTYHKLQRLGTLRRKRQEAARPTQAAKRDHTSRTPKKGNAASAAH